MLEELNRRQRDADQAARIATSITQYYDSLRDQEVAEDRAWEQFALTQFPPED